MRQRFLQQLTLCSTLLCATVLAQEQRSVPGYPERNPVVSSTGAQQDAGTNTTAVMPPRRFVTHHQVSIAGQRMRITATAGETYLYSDNGEPIASVFSYAYTRDDVAAVSRPVTFVTGGGPGSSSFFLQVAFGPWGLEQSRLAVEGTRMPPVTPPYTVIENADSLLDATDLVFIDPVGTGYSTTVGTGKGKDFWGIDEDADAIAQFIQLWITRNGRWDSPKFFMGESYGGTRAAVVTLALAGGTSYQGYIRGIALNGVISLVNTLGMSGVGNDGIGALANQALSLPNYAATAWYHETIDRKGRSLQAFYDEVSEFAATEYLDALSAEPVQRLSAETRAAIVTKLVSYTGLPASAFDRSIALTSIEFTKQALAARGLEVGLYDSRFVTPAGRGAGDLVADDAALARTTPVFVGAYQNIEHSKLKVQMDRPYTPISLRNVFQSWNYQHKPTVYGVPFSGSSADELAAAMTRNDRLHVMVATGYFDLLMTPAAARFATSKARMPQDRLVLKAYEAGHEPYVEGVRAQLSRDIRELIRKASR